MTLDELELLARNVSYFSTSTTSSELARAILAMLPVVRASLEWRAQDDKDDFGSIVAVVEKLEQAIDTYQSTQP